jgi:hypothetical protein
MPNFLMLGLYPMLAIFSTISLFAIAIYLDEIKDILKRNKS